MTRSKGPELERFGHEDDVERLVELIRLCMELKSLLQQILESDIKGLPDDAQAMLKRAQAELTGPDLANLPAVARALGDAGSEAVAAGSEIPALIESIESLFRRLKASMAKYKKAGQAESGKGVTP